MTEIEKTDHQLNVARELSKGVLATPCISITRKGNKVESITACPFLDVENGCQKEDGFIMEPGKSVSCPDGKGKIVIGSEKIIEVLKPHQVYALQIANDNVSLKFAERAEYRASLLAE